MPFNSPGVFRFCSSVVNQILQTVWHASLPWLYCQTTINLHESVNPKINSVTKHHVPFLSASLKLVWRGRVVDKSADDGFYGSFMTIQFVAAVRAYPKVTLSLKCHHRYCPLISAAKLFRQLSHLRVTCRPYQNSLHTTFSLLLYPSPLSHFLPAPHHPHQT